MNEIKIKSFNEYVRYYEGSGILPILEDVYYTDYLNAINYFKLLPKYEKLEKRIIKYKKQIETKKQHNAFNKYFYEIKEIEAFLEKLGE